MNPEDEAFEDQNNESGSDELLSEDDLRLPEGANILVRVHAVRAWLARRKRDTDLAIGQAALELQTLMQDTPEQARPRRRRAPASDPYSRVLTVQAELQATQERLQAYTEAEELLEDAVTHNTSSSDRVLVEYYLAVENLLFEDEQPPLDTDAAAISQTIRKQVFEDVLHRIERVTAPELD